MILVSITMKVPHVRFCNTSSVHCTACSSQPQSSLLCHHVFVLSLLFHIRSIRSSCSAFQIYPESDAFLKRSMATTIFSDPDYGHILLAHLPASTCASPPCPCSLLNRENRSILFKKLYHSKPLWGPLWSGVFCYPSFAHCCSHAGNLP